MNVTPASTHTSLLIVVVFVAAIVILLVVVILHNLPPGTVSTLILLMLLGRQGGVVVTILAAWDIKEIDVAMLGLCHVGVALFLELHLAVAEGAELVVGLSPPFGHMHGWIGQKQFLGGIRDTGLEVDHLRSPPESTRSVRGHLIAHHLLGSVVIGNYMAVAC